MIKTFFINILLIATSAVLMVGCRCESRLKRIARTCPQFFEPQTLIDTVLVKEFNTDTQFVIQKAIDTFIINKDRVNVKIMKYIDTMKVFIKVPQDTIIVTRTVELPETPCLKKHRDRLTDFFMWFGVVSIGLLIGFGIIKYR